MSENAWRLNPLFPWSLSQSPKAVPDSDLQSALNQRLGTLAGGLPVAWENAPYTPAAGTPYLQAWLLPAETAVETIGELPWQQRRGVFQVSCCYPVGKGWGPAKAKAAAIVDHFKAGTKLSYNTLEVICEKAWPGPGVIDTESGWYRVPVSVMYRCHSNA